MRSATIFSDQFRAAHGLPELATGEDLMLAVTPSGEPVDRYKIVASRMFSVPYENVTEQQRKAAKAATYHHAYA